MLRFLSTNRFRTRAATIISLYCSVDVELSPRRSLSTRHLSQPTSRFQMCSTVLVFCQRCASRSAGVVLSVASSSFCHPAAASSPRELSSHATSHPWFLVCFVVLLDQIPLPSVSLPWTPCHDFSFIVFLCHTAFAAMELVLPFSFVVVLWPRVLTLGLLFRLHRGLDLRSNYILLCSSNTLSLSDHWP